MLDYCRANTSVIWVSLHFGPFNQWKWGWAASFLWQNGLVAKPTPLTQLSFPTDFWLLIYFFGFFSFSLFLFLRSEHPQVRPCPNTVHRQHCQREQTWFKAVSLLTWTNQPGWRKAKGDNVDGGGASSVDGIALEKTDMSRITIKPPKKWKKNQQKTMASALKSTSEEKENQV